MTLDGISKNSRVRVRLDECGDKTIPGRRDHLWMDGPLLCAMFVDAPPIQRQRLAALGGKVWQGDISRNARCRRVQDATTTGIPYENCAAALRLVGAKKRRVLSAEWEESGEGSHGTSEENQ